MTDHQVQRDTDFEAEPQLLGQTDAPAQETTCIKAEPNEYYARILSKHKASRRDNRPRSDELLARITINPGILGGKPIIRGMRFAVEHVLGMLVAGETVETILKDYSALKPEDIQACLIFAHRMVAGEEMYIRVTDQADS